MTSRTRCPIYLTNFIGTGLPESAQPQSRYTTLFGLISLFLSTAALSLLLSFSRAEAAGTTFILDFEADAGATFTQLDCNRGTGSVNCNNSLYPVTDMTPILQEFVTIDGENYQHQIIGDPATGWAQDIYLHESSGICQNFSCFNNAPLSSAENATGFPTKAAIRQTMTSTNGTETFTMDFLKDTLLFKPRLTSTLVSDEVNYAYDSDMRAIDYNTLTVSAPVSIIFSLVNPEIPPTVTVDAPTGGNFDLMLDSDYSDIVAGKVTFNEGDGTYTYSSPGSDYNLNQDWAWTFDYSQNTDCNTIRPECP